MPTKIEISLDAEQYRKELENLIGETRQAGAKMSADLTAGTGHTGRAVAVTAEVSGKVKTRSSPVETEDTAGTDSRGKNSNSFFRFRSSSSQPPSAEKFDCFPEHFTDDGKRQDPTEQKQQNGQLARCPNQSDD